MRLLLLLLPLGLFAQEEDEDKLGKALYDNCLKAIQLEEDFESVTGDKLIGAFVCFATYRTFINTLYSVETAFALAEFDAHPETLSEPGFKSGVIYMYDQIRACDELNRITSGDFAYSITDYIRDNPKYRNELFTNVIWDWASTECEISSFKLPLD